MSRLRIPLALAVLAIAVLAVFGVVLLKPYGLRQQDAGSVTVEQPPQGPPRIAVVEVAGGAGRLMNVASPADRTLTDEGVKRLEDFARRTGTTALLVWQGGALQLEWYGDGARPFDRLPGLGLEAGLMTLLAGKALSQGYFTSLDDPIRGWLPEWAGDPRGAITVRQLLIGVSGLAAPTEPAPEQGLGSWTLSLPLKTAPGTEFQPNMAEMQVLGLVLTRATRRPLADYLADALWQPLGARPAEWRADPVDGVADLTGGFAAAPRDWLRLGVLMLQGGAVEGAAVVSTPFVEEMRRPTLFARNDGLRVRLGWPFEPANAAFMAAARFREPDTAWLAGQGGQRLYMAQGADLVILRLGKPVDAWDESELPNLVAAHLQVPQQRPRRAGGPSSSIELPPITKPPPMPKVESVPLDQPPTAPRP